MEFFEAEGVFWHPDRPDREIPGTLSLESDGLRLNLYSSMMPGLEDRVYRSPERVDEAVMHGRLRERSEDVTCLNVSGWSLLTPFSTGTDVFRVGVVLRGGHASNDVSTRATVRFDHLSGWCPMPSIVTSANGNRMTMRTDSQTLATAAWKGITFTLRVERRKATHLARVGVDQEVVIDIEGPEATLDHVLQTRVRPLQDFLMICTGRHVALTGLSMMSSDSELPPLPLRVVFDALQRPAEDLDRTWSTRLASSPALYFPDDKQAPQFDVVLPAWLDVRETHYDVVQRLLSSFYAPFTYSENRLASMYQTAEAFAKATLPTTQLSTYQVRTKVRPVIKHLKAAGVPELDRERVRKILSRNDKTLNELFSDLLEASGAVGESLANVNDLPGAWTFARTGASHGGAEQLSGVRTYWLAQALWWLMRARLLEASGVPASVLDDRVLKKSDFLSVLHELGSGSSAKPEAAAVEGSSTEGSGPEAIPEAVGDHP